MPLMSAVYNIFTTFPKIVEMKSGCTCFFPLQQSNPTYGNLALHMVSCAYLPQTRSNILSIQKNSNTCGTIHMAPVQSAPGHLLVVQLRTV